MSKLGETRSMHLIMFYIQFMNSLEGLGMFFSSTGLIRRLRRYAATIAVITKPDFKCEYLFRICSVVTNLLTSLEFQPNSCATMLCHFGRTRKGYVANPFILLSSSAESSATNGYVVVPERIGQSEARDGRNVERAKKKPSFVSSSGFSRCSM